MRALSDMQRRLLGEEYPTLRPDGDPDIERYFESVYAEEPLLRDKSDATKMKLKQQLMKNMVEAGLVKKQGDSFAVTRPNITARLANQLTADGDSEYLKALGGEGGAL